MDSASDERVKNSVVRHEYRVLTDEEKLQMQRIKDLGQHFLDQLDNQPACREVSIARTKIEEAVMWGVKGLTR